jgi:hypothetical protein
MAISYLWTMILFISSLGIGSTEGISHIDLLTPTGDVVEITIKEQAVDSPMEGAHKKLITMKTPEGKSPEVTANFVDNGLYQLSIADGSEEPINVDLAPLFIEMQYSFDAIPNQSFTMEGSNFIVTNTRSNVFIIVPGEMTFIVSK